MRLLFDTHILYWWFYDTKRLSASTVQIIKDADEVFVSSASIWEIAIKFRLGKMSADPDELIQKIGETDFQELPIFARHAAMVARLPMHHGDPFDRLLVAQAINEPLHLLTADTQLKPYSELVLCI